MAFYPVGDACLVTVEYGATVYLWTNTLWFRKAGFNSADQAALTSLVAEWADTYIMPNLCSAWSRQRVRSTDMRTSTGGVQEISATGDAGGQGANPSPISVCGVVTLYTAGRGRSARGRNYVSGFDEADTDSINLSDGGIISSLETAYATLITSAAAIGWAFCIAQRFEEGERLAEGVLHTVTACTIRNSKLGSQRRRIARP